LETIYCQLKLQKFDLNSVIYEQNDPAETIYFIKKG